MMANQDNTLISHFLEDLKVELMISNLSKCKSNWTRYNFTPPYSKIYFIVEGVGKLEVGGQELFPLPGQMVFAPAGLPQMYSLTDESRTYTMFWCHFISNISFMSLFSLFKLPFLLTAADPDKAISCFETLVHSYRQESGPAKSIRQQAALLNVISCYLEQAILAQPQTTGSLQSSKMCTVLQYIDHNLTKDLSIAELASLVHHHPNYFIRFFKSHLGITPMTFILERRLEKAKQLIVSSDMTIGEVSQATGFHDIFHFSKSFRKRHGLAPTEFRSLYSERHLKDK
jgi:AraC family transcriptional regulator of arabinose operon